MDTTTAARKPLAPTSVTPAYTSVTITVGDLYVAPGGTSFLVISVRGRIKFAIRNPGFAKAHTDGRPMLPAKVADLISTGHWSLIGNFKACVEDYI